MSRLDQRWARLPRSLRLAVVLATALLDVGYNLSGTDLEPWRVACGLLACAALPARRRYPVPVLLLTLPGTAVLDLYVAPFVALYAVAATTTRRGWLTALTVLTAFAAANPWPLPLQPGADRADVPAYFLYSLAWLVTPVVLARLSQARRDLAEQLVRVREVETQERELHAQAVLAQERARLAREMHDVVSHQVSLVTVHAGALQVSTADPAAREAAATIRRLAVATLDELRGMVSVLRASGGALGSTAPQPTVGDLDELVGSAGIAVGLEGELPAGLTTPVQRAIYRTVQEALTNIRKHAPGAAATVVLWCRGATAGVTVTNGPGTGPPLTLPQSGLGLVGLRERAAALHGSLTSGSTESGGFVVELSVPVGPGHEDRPDPEPDRTEP